jgi:uncharacterized membrane protein YphA (DoxX/SURF4 family)
LVLLEWIPFTAPGPGKPFPGLFPCSQITTVSSEDFKKKGSLSGRIRTLKDISRERKNLRQIILSDWIYRIVRVVYVVLFLYAGVNKLLNPRAFATVIDAFGLVPDPLIMAIAFALPVLEIVAAFGLLFDVRGSLGLVTGLLVFFMAVVSYGIRMGLDIDCGCFGPGDLEGEAYRGLRPAFYRNLVLIAGIAYLYSWRFIRAVKPVRLELLLDRIRYREE